MIQLTPISSSDPVDPDDPVEPDSKKTSSSDATGSPESGPHLRACDKRREGASRKKERNKQRKKERVQGSKGPRIQGTRVQWKKGCKRDLNTPEAQGLANFKEIQEIRSPPNG